MVAAAARKTGLALIGLAALAGCDALPSAAPADQAVPMAFQQCLTRIDETAARIGQSPAVLAETSESRIVRFTDEGEIVTVTCDALASRMVVQTRPAPTPMAEPAF
ncbi:MAG: hypothetical protein ACU0E9_09120 [Limimaricola soesokkakensis]|uniref:hypothetical protein n=1 Tax=Limimaricola TaxID=2211638 RepID=UPI0022B05371|nr:hypothetical protein [Limimaricola sp. G21655-S1]MCZ4259287.1 hypothetical protein [Limimaricola sp. G21655-S1]